MNKKIFLMMLILFQTAEAANDNQKPIAQIESPEKGSRFEIGEKVELKGKATDLEDGKLSGDVLVWTADGDYIGKGDSFAAVFSKGYHMIVLTVADSKGALGESSVFIAVGIPEPIIDEIEIEKSEPNNPKTEIQETLVTAKRKLPYIEFVFVPPFGSSEDLKGRLVNGDPNQFGIAVYIMVEAVWSSKPSLANPVTKINEDGTWVCDITTSEDDDLAIKIAAYLIPVGFKPPTAYRNFYILKEIKDKSLANIEVTRKISGKIESREPVFTKEQPEFRKYFPLAVGNTWKYRKTVFQNRDAFYYSQQIMLEDGSNNNFKKGTVLFSVGRTQSKAPETSIENYTISSFIEDEGEIIWEVKIEGNSVRDGRYDSFMAKENPNVRWRYKDNAVWEIIDGEYLGTLTQNQSLIAVLEPGVIISSPLKQGTVPAWAIGSVLNGTVNTSAGRFEKCLKNCTIIKGENLEDILTKNASPRFSDGDDSGKFVTLSYFKKGIGLVMESQYNHKGEIIYELALIDYKVTMKGDEK